MIHEQTDEQTNQNYKRGSLKVNLKISHWVKKDALMQLNVNTKWSI